MHEAKTRLSQLVAAAEAGEEVVIARAGKPAVRLVVDRKPVKRKLGQFPELAVEDDFFSAELDAEIAEEFRGA